MGNIKKESKKKDCEKMNESTRGEDDNENENINKDKEVKRNNKRVNDEEKEATKDLSGKRKMKASKGKLENSNEEGGEEKAENEVKTQKAGVNDRDNGKTPTKVTKVMRTPSKKKAPSGTKTPNRRKTPNGTETPNKARKTKKSSLDLINIENQQSDCSNLQNFKLCEISEMPLENFYFQDQKIKINEITKIDSLSLAKVPALGGASRISCVEYHRDLIFVGLKGEMKPLNLFEFQNGPSILQVYNAELEKIWEANLGDHGIILKMKFVSRDAANDGGRLKTNDSIEIIDNESMCCGILFNSGRLGELQITGLLKHKFRGTIGEELAQEHNHTPQEHCRASGVVGWEYKEIEGGNIIRFDKNRGITVMTDGWHLIVIEGEERRVSQRFKCMIVDVCLITDTDGAANDNNRNQKGATANDKKDTAANNKKCASDNAPNVYICAVNRNGLIFYCDRNFENIVELRSIRGTSRIAYDEEMKMIVTREDISDGHSRLHPFEKVRRYYGNRYWYCHCRRNGVLSSNVCDRKGVQKKDLLMFVGTEAGLLVLTESENFGRFSGNEIGEYRALKSKDFLVVVFEFGMLIRVNLAVAKGIF